ncbi:MAG: hypothetical protein EA339_00240 [Rhodobacteraceae bacterium]|nr:MAG: hypothetical protein EA339_00240 [Paracoccaceae bacterium]
MGDFPFKVHLIDDQYLSRISTCKKPLRPAEISAMPALRFWAAELLLPPFIAVRRRGRVGGKPLTLWPVQSGEVTRMRDEKRRLIPADRAPLPVQGAGGHIGRFLHRTTPREREEGTKFLT